jgi:hypothetical protein
MWTQLFTSSEEFGISLVINKNSKVLSSISISDITSMNYTNTPNSRQYKCAILVTWYVKILDDNINICNLANVKTQTVIFYIRLSISSFFQQVYLMTLSSEVQLFHMYLYSLTLFFNWKSFLTLIKTT